MKWLLLIVCFLIGGCAGTHNQLRMCEQQRELEAARVQELNAELHKNTVRP
jgi:uncharacterized lipoprotein YmbA